jgi:hypothetical protein
MAVMESENRKLRSEIRQNEQLISNGAFMAFSSCLKQVEFLNPRVQLTYKGVHPLHGIGDGKLYHYDNDPPTCVDLNDPELEAFDRLADQAISSELTETEEAAPADILISPHP